MACSARLNNCTKWFIFCILSVLALYGSPSTRAGTSLGNTYFVRTTGDDANDGLTVNTAFATIQKAVNSCAGPGNTIYIGKGAYSEMVEIGINNGAAAGSGTANDPNKIIGDYTGQYTGDGSGPVIIDGGGTENFGINLRDRDGWMIHGMYLQNQLQYSIYTYQANDLTISNNTIIVPPYFAIYSYYSENLRIEDCTLLRTLQTGHCIFAWGATGLVVVDRNRLTITGSDYLGMNYQNGFTFQRDSPNGLYGLAYGIIILGNFNYWNSNNNNNTATPSQIYVQNNIISDAYLGAYAGVFGASDTAYVSNNSLAGCYYGLFGYAYSGTVTLSDNIVTHSYHAGGGYAYNLGVVSIDGLISNVITSVPVIYNYNDTIITSNILEDTDPLWVDPANGDFSLPIDSPAVDTAVGSYLVPDDIRGIARPYNARGLPTAISDYGAYEFDPTVDGDQRPALVQWQESDPDR